MAFEDVDGKGTERGPAHLTIRPKKPHQAYLTVGAVREFFSDTDRIRFRVDRDRSLVALVPDEIGEETYSLSRKDGGAVIAVTQTLRALDVAEDRISETHHCSVYQDEERGYVVADLSSVVEDATEDAHCPECGKRFHRNGIQQHLTKSHGDSAYATLRDADPDEIGDPLPDEEVPSDA